MGAVNSVKSERGCQGCIRGFRKRKLFPSVAIAITPSSKLAQNTGINFDTVISLSSVSKQIELYSECSVKRYYAV